MFLMQEPTIIALSTLFRRIGCWAHSLCSRYCSRRSDCMEYPPTP